MSTVASFVLLLEATAVIGAEEEAGGGGPSPPPAADSTTLVLTDEAVGVFTEEGALGNSVLEEVTAMGLVRECTVRLLMWLAMVALLALGWLLAALPNVLVPTCVVKSGRGAADLKSSASEKVALKLLRITRPLPPATPPTALAWVRFVPLAEVAK